MFGFSFHLLVAKACLSLLFCCFFPPVSFPLFKSVLELGDLLILCIFSDDSS